ncbi:hypothetical protein [Streptomyces sp. TP-A0874]|uniref:hypothetical protein n=1 Tax=Streptomyces sp. TP-A0874 TaxID=549819 RepID=UPI0008536D00|nr:hypothetical protein [Streptomyces sp. TP-A0874]
MAPALYSVSALGLLVSLAVLPSPAVAAQDQAQDHVVGGSAAATAEAAAGHPWVEASADSPSGPTPPRPAAAGDVRPAETAPPEPARWDAEADQVRAGDPLGYRAPRALPGGLVHEVGGPGSAVQNAEDDGADSVHETVTEPSGRLLRVLPLGTGFALVGLGLGFFGIRLRRG